jgi:hypothetical protein
VIGENAHLALQDLREVIGVLRAPTEASRAEVETVQTGPAPPGWASAPWASCPSPPWPTSASSSKTHVSSILAKLDLNNRVQVALLAHDAGLLDDQG